jgi:REP element-mobilizing transposase RayT
MSTYTQIIYHIVFSTKKRENILVKENRPLFFEYTWGILKNKKCHLYRLNGVEDHLHILTHLPPSLPLSDLVRDIKTATSLWIKENKIFPNFNGWQDGYGAFSCSYKEKDALIAYIKNQEEHHKVFNFEEEYRTLLAENGIAFDEKYLF